MSERSDIDIVIPTWNGRALLERCLQRLEQQTVSGIVTVVDNGSKDGTAALVEARFPSVRLVSLPENRGFASAVNSGIAVGTSAYVVLLNNDVECDPEFVEQIVAPLEERPEAGMVAGLLLQPGRRRIDSFGLELDRTLAAFPRFARRPYPETRLHDDGLLGPSGGAAAYRREAFEGAGGFDESMFAYMDDTDLALRLRAAGWGCAGAQRAVGVHLGSATIGRRSRRQVAIAAASRGYMLRKYGVLRSGFVTAVWALAVELGVATLETLIGRDLAAFRGRLAGWRAASGSQAELPAGAINREIGLGEALRRRRAAIRPPQGAGA